MFIKRPLQVAGKAQGYSQFQEILKLGSYDAVCDDIVDKVFMRLESEKNTRSLITKILANTYATVDNKTQARFLAFRHLFNH